MGRNDKHAILEGRELWKQQDKSQLSQTRKNLLRLKPCRSVEMGWYIQMLKENNYQLRILYPA